MRPSPRTGYGWLFLTVTGILAVSLDDGDGVGRRDGYAAEHASAEPFGAVDQTIDVARRGRERMQCQRALCGLDLAGSRTRMPYGR